jgi:hypothetical protein
MSPIRAARVVKGEQVPVREDPTCKHIVEPVSTAEQNPKDESENNSEAAAAHATARCTACDTEEHDARVYRWKVIGSLILPFTLQAFDVTMYVRSAKC